MEFSHRRFYRGVAQLPLVNGGNAEFLRFVKHEAVGRCVVIGDLSVEDGILDGIFDITHGTRGVKAEGYHDFLTVNRRLEIANPVFLLNVNQFLLHQVKILAEALHLVLVLAGDVCLAQGHQVINVVTGIKEQTPHSTVSHFVLDKSNRTHVQSHKFFHIFHVLIERQAHLGENLGNHLLADKVVVVKSPSQLRVPTLGAGLAHIMQYRSPPQPDIIAGRCHIVQHLECVHKVILVPAAIDRFNALERCQFGKYERQQTALFQQYPSARGLVAAHDFHQFLSDTLTGNDIDALRIPSDGLKSLRENVKIQLGGKPHCTHHPQRVVTEGDVRVEWRADDATFQISYAVKWVKQLTITLLVQADGHCVDGEIAAALIIIEGAVFHNGVTALAMIRLTAGTHKFQFPLAGLDLCCTIGAEYRKMSPFAQVACHSLCYLDAAADGHKVHVVAGAFQEDVPDVTAHNVTFAS